MKRWIGVSSIIIGLVATSACSRRDEDRAKSESREAQDKARIQLDEANRKLKEGLEEEPTNRLARISTRRANSCGTR